MSNYYKLIIHGNGKDKGVLDPYLFSNILESASLEAQILIIEDIWNKLQSAIDEKNIDLCRELLFITVGNIRSINITEKHQKTVHDLVALFIELNPDYFIGEEQESSSIYGFFENIYFLFQKTYSVLHDCVRELSKILEKSKVEGAERFIQRLYRKQFKVWLCMILRQHKDISEESREENLERYRKEYFDVCINLEGGIDIYRPTHHINYALKEYLDNEKLPSYLRFFSIHLFIEIVQRCKDDASLLYFLVREYHELLQSVAFILSSLTENEKREYKDLFEDIDIVLTLSKYYDEKGIEEILLAILSIFIVPYLCSWIENDDVNEFPRDFYVYTILSCIEERGFCLDILSKINDHKEIFYIVKQLADKEPNVEWIQKYYNEKFEEQIREEAEYKNVVEQWQNTISDLRQNRIKHDVKSVFDLKLLQADIEKLSQLSQESLFFIDGNFATTYNHLYYSRLERLVGWPLYNRKDKLEGALKLLQDYPPNQVAVYCASMLRMSSKTKFSVEITLELIYQVLQGNISDLNIVKDELLEYSSQVKKIIEEYFSSHSEDKNIVLSPLVIFRIIQGIDEKKNMGFTFPQWFCDELIQTIVSSSIVFYSKKKQESCKVYPVDSFGRYREIGNIEYEANPYSALEDYMDQTYLFKQSLEIIQYWIMNNGSRECPTYCILYMVYKISNYEVLDNDLINTFYEYIYCVYIKLIEHSLDSAFERCIIENVLLQHMKNGTNVGKKLVDLINKKLSRNNIIAFSEKGVGIFLCLYQENKDKLKSVREILIDVYNDNSTILTEEKRFLLSQVLCYDNEKYFTYCMDYIFEAVKQSVDEYKDEPRIKSGIYPVPPDRINLSILFNNKDKISKRYLILISQYIVKYYQLEIPRIGRLYGKVVNYLTDILINQEYNKEDFENVKVQFASLLEDSLELKTVIERYIFVPIQIKWGKKSM